MKSAGSVRKECRHRALPTWTKQNDRRSNGRKKMKVCAKRAAVAEADNRRDTALVAVGAVKRFGLRSKHAEAFAKTEKQRVVNSLVELMVRSRLLLQRRRTSACKELNKALHFVK